jgi:hypothetical protein
LDLITGEGFPEQDYIILDGVKSPGRATISGAGKPREWDIRKGYGYSGATVTFTGEGLSKFEVLIELWLPKHFAEWNRFSKHVLSKSPRRGVSGKSPSLKIEHPVLEMDPLKITDVVIEDVSQFEQDDEGMWSCKIKFIQYRAPLPALASAGAPTPSVSATIPRTAEDAVEIEISRLTSQFNNLAGQ